MRRSFRMLSAYKGVAYDLKSTREGGKRGTQKVEEEGVHLPGAVFRNPVARVRQVLDALEVRDPEGGRLGEPPAQESVPQTPDHEHRCLYPFQQRLRLPRLPEEGAIVVEGRGERPRPRQSLHVSLDVLSREALRPYRVSTQGGAQEGKVTCADNLLRQPGDLEEEHVRAPQQLPRAFESIQEASRVRNVEDREPPDASGVAHRRDPGNYSAPIMPDHGSR